MRLFDNTFFLEGQPMKSTQRLNLVIIFVLTAAGFLLWVSGLLFLWLFLRMLGIGVNYWAMTEALSTAVAASAVLSAGFIAYRELKAQDISRYIEVADRLYNELNSPENISARRWVFTNLPEYPGDNIRSLDEEGRQAIKQVLNSLDRVAFLTREGWIPEEMIMPWMNPMIVKAWKKLEPYVDYESKRRHEPDYYQAAREIAQKCIRWRKANVPEAEITWVEDAL
jgi:hypothetical protein